MNIKYTTESWIKSVQEKWHYDYDYSKVKYINAKEKVCIICHVKDENGIEHGEFWQEANSHKYHGCRCPKCFPSKYNVKNFIDKANKVHNKTYNYDKVKYIDSSTPVEIICPIHGSFWQLPKHHLQGRGCTYCHPARFEILTTEEWIRRANIIHNGFYKYDKTIYTGCTNEVIITCPEHGDFLQKPRNHINGRGCSKCVLKSQEKLFSKLQKDINEELIWEYSSYWLKSQRIDMFFPKYNIGVEYQGIQHYKVIEAWDGEEGLKIRQEADERKYKKCLENNVKLFYIKYNYTNEDYQSLVLNIKNIIKSTT